ncbi:MAG: acetyl-coenzyme A synthetase N-terminal domain-containing protein [Cutibacterium avidum]|nr:acetyl-coenzyme A synthetase N-terminal domain-containing protein [Cutibacterium avidum]
MADQQDVFEPDQSIIDNAWVSDWKTLEEKAKADPVAYWEERARELEWSKPWDKILDDSGKPFFKWFTGARTNIVTNAVDRHLDTARRNKLALIWVGENTDEVRTFSYFALRVTSSRSICLGSLSCSSRCWPAPRSVPFTRWSSPVIPRRPSTPAPLTGRGSTARSSR